MAKYDKEGLVLVLDVGISMSTRLNNSTSTYLQTCVDIIQMIIQRKIFQTSKDELGLILYGTNETANDLWDGNSDHYSHIVLARQLCEVDWKLLDYVQNKISTSLIEGDLIDAITVASDHLHQQSLKRKFKEKRIILFTDYSSLSNDENVDEIRDALKTDSIRLDIVSPFEELDNNDDEKRNSDTPHEHRACNDTYDGKQMTNEQMNNQRILKRILSDNDGCLYSFSEVLTLLSLYQAKSVKSLGTKYIFEIGLNLKLPIVSTIKVKENKPDLFKFKKVYAKDEQIELKTDRARFTKDDEQRDLDEKTETVDAYRYGSTYIPIDDPESLRYSNDKCFTLLGFTKAENIKPYYYLGDSVHEVTVDVSKADEQQEQAFVSMVSAMREENFYGIVRKVFNCRSSPQMCCLIPFVNETTGELSLLMNDLPYEDDLRKFTLENFCNLKKFKPTEKQLNLVDELIDNMDLISDETEAYDPKLTFNPYIQRMFQTMALKATNPDAELPDFESHITNNLVRKVFSEETNTLLKRMNDEFYTRDIDRKKQKLDETKNLFASNNGDVKEKGEEIGADDDKGEQANVGIEDIYAAIKSTKIRKIGTINPVNDFNALLGTINTQNSDEFEQLTDQLVNLVKEFLSESVGFSEQPNLFHTKTFECIKALRNACLKHNHANIYNGFLTNLKVYLFDTNENKKYKSKFVYFWRYAFVESGEKRLGLVTSDESSVSKISVQEADEFIQSPLAVPQVGAEAEQEESRVASEENEEDLLDLM